MERDKFQEILGLVTEIHERNKNCNGEDLSNFRICERMGVPAWKGVLVTVGEKVGCLMNIAKSEDPEVEPETVAKMLTELAEQSIVARMLLEEPAPPKQPDSGPRKGHRQGRRKRKVSTDETVVSLPEETLSQPVQE
jgi:hypothetical protein